MKLLLPIVVLCLLVIGCRSSNSGSGDFDAESCDAVLGTLDIHWEQIAGDGMPCTGIEYTDGTAEDASDGAIAMAGTSASDDCIFPVTYELEVSEDGLTLDGADTDTDVKLIFTRNSDEACFVGHWISGDYDYIGHIAAEVFGVDVE
jgi:hypothetical protein